MVRFNNATVTTYTESVTMNDEGDMVQSYVVAEVIVGDVQPNAMTEDELRAYGISERKGEVKLFLYNGLHASIKSGNRASVASEFTQDTKMYTIMPVNAWSRHGECLLVPVENE